MHSESWAWQVTKPGRWPQANQPFLERCGGATVDVGNWNVVTVKCGWKAGTHSRS